LYEATIVDADESNTVYQVKYEKYDETEERPGNALCPLHCREFVGDDWSHQRRRTNDRQEHRQVIDVL